MPHRQARQPLTVLIVPHSQRQPISICLPSWTLSALFFVFLAVLSTLAFFAMRHYALMRELAALREAQQVSQTRQQELRQTILAQHDEVKDLEQSFNTQISAVQRDYDQLHRQATAFQESLMAQVERFKLELQQIQQLSGEIRDLVGLEDEPTPSPRSSLEGSSSRGGVGAGITQVRLGSVGSRSIAMSTRQLLNPETNPAVQQLQTLQDSLPARLSELQLLKEEVAKRVSLIDPAKRQNPEELERQLRLWDAAPKGWPLGGRITSTFGYRIFRGRRDFHTGIDIGVWYRTPVRATAGGVVIAAGWERGYGWTVEIRHDMGYSTLYGHLSRYLVDVGDTVKRGQLIGLSGNSGNSTGPHLHYEIRFNGVPIDPWRYATAYDH